MSILEYAAFFLIYSVIGWITEVIYQAVAKGNITNRGFLNGPVCPVYGSGVVAVLAVYNLIGSDNLAVLFMEGLILATSIELFAGWILDKLFHARWWDYSEMPYNLNGYICPAFSIIWGLAIVFVIRIGHPIIARLTVDMLPNSLIIVLLIIFGTVMTADTILTALTIIGLNKKLAELDDISRSMSSISDKMSEHIGSSSLKTAQAIGNNRVQYALAKSELKDAANEVLQAAEQAKNERIDELRRRYEAITSKITATGSRHFGAGRIIRAFPQARHDRYRDRLIEIQSKLRSHSKRDRKTDSSRNSWE